MRYLPLILLLVSTINVFGQAPIQINKILNQLDINASKCKLDLIRYKALPNTPEETIAVIPEITYEDEHIFELNSHILIVNTKSSKIINSFFESSNSNNWVSDAVVLTNISIDTAPYYLSNQKRAFGIRVQYNGSSSVNPYSYETLSLFEKENKTLKRILKNYIVEVSQGEWDGNCTGEFNSEKKVLIITDHLTNSYMDILVKSSITNRKNHIDNNGNCYKKETTSKKSNILKYENGQYKPNLL